METFDDEITEKTLAYLDARAEDKEPFFLWHNSSRMHVFLHLQEERKGTSRAGSQDIYGEALKEHDNHVGKILAKLDETGLTENTIVVWVTDNGAYTYMWPEGGTSPFRGDKGTTWEGGLRVPAAIRWPGVEGGRTSSELVSILDLFPTLAAAAGETDVVSKLKAGHVYGDSNFKVHLDGFDQTALFTGQSDESTRKALFYYDETTLTAIRYEYYKVIFSAKLDGNWDDPLVDFGRPWVINLRMDPFERNMNNVARRLAEHKTWVLTPMVGLIEQHFKSFEEFSVRQLGLSAEFGKTIEKIQDQVLRVQRTQ